MLKKPADNIIQQAFCFFLLVVMIEFCIFYLRGVLAFHSNIKRFYLFEVML